jgi:hypothetical protein
VSTESDESIIAQDPSDEDESYELTAEQFDAYMLAKAKEQFEAIEDKDEYISSIKVCIEKN